ncbi:MAG: histidine kinase [Acidobacteria bacterium]|nr:histidine kinase [Acidobacteriota bacterium]
MAEHAEPRGRYGMRMEEFSSLMAYRVREILLVASPYDAFVLEEDGQLTELIFQEYRNLDLNLRYAPRFTRPKNAEEGLKLLSTKAFDMVLATPRVPGMDLEIFAQRLKDVHPGIPLGVLAAHAWDLPRLNHLASAAGTIDWLFLWQGDVKTLLAMIKQVEDRRNAEHDVLQGGVQAIILIEDEPRFYSAYLPDIYTEVTTQTSRLMAEGINLSHRLLRIRARPKILLGRTYEEGLRLFNTFFPNVLGVISDMSFPRDGSEDREAGLKLARRIRKTSPDVPVLLQSSDARLESLAKEVGAAFLHKESPTLLEDMRHFITQKFGFGDFVFKLPDGTEVGRARDMREMLVMLRKVPDESLVFHAARNHFSAWLKARTEFELASALRPRQVTDFESAEKLRAFLVDRIEGYLKEIRRHTITDFDRERYDSFVAFAKIGSGSLGGKGRGLAFVHKLLARGQPDIPGVQIEIPRTVVLSSDLFEEFLTVNNLRNLFREADSLSDDEILRAFCRSRFPHERRADLARFLECVTTPLAVRSSSILEDSLYQPFAGVYATVMLPNNHPSLDIRLAQLLEAVKVVYASTFQKRARDYLKGTPHRVEEERMAVLVQRLVGSRHKDLFYPTLAGVALSYNFYPFRDMRPEDGVALIALGLGKSVVDGIEALRFCPKYPQVLPQFSNTKDMLRNAQRHFYALDLGRDDVIPNLDYDANLRRLEVLDALDDGVSHRVMSTYLPANDAVTSGVVNGGTPLVTFASVLNGRAIRLPDVLVYVLKMAAEAMGTPVEIEFAIDLDPRLGAGQTFHVLQIRPMVVEQVIQEVDVTPELLAGAIVASKNALGHGYVEDIQDLIVVDSRRFDRAKTVEAAAIIEKLNARLLESERPAALIGPGRWGSQDRWLGIPVAWGQISAARVIVETDFADLEVEPSQGSHFFHNLACFGVAYLTVHEAREAGEHVDWEWLFTQPAEDEYMDGIIRHVHLEKPLGVMVDGRTGTGAVFLRHLSRRSGTSGEEDRNREILEP